jgi:hypothetical protein
MRFWNTASKQNKYTLGTDPKENHSIVVVTNNRPRTDQNENAPAAVA